ncbi:MAG TPA: hypothetical protein PKA53_01370 [Sphingobacterium sp.]|nr:hypothetical protein [Sphingobacterium sp.]
MSGKLSFVYIYAVFGKMGLLVAVGLIFFSCTTQVHVTRSGFKSYPPKGESDSVVIYNNPKDIPIDSEKIGRLTTSCVQWMGNCDYTAVISLAEPKIRKIGGNALLITEYNKPSLWNANNFLLEGDVFLVNDFSSPSDTVLSFEEKYLYGGIGVGPETGISIPKISFYDFQKSKYLETYYGVEAGIWWIERFWMSLDCLYGVKKSIFTFDTSIGGWWSAPRQDVDINHYFHTTINPKIGIKFWKIWLKSGPSFHLYRTDTKVNLGVEPGKIGNRYYNFEILVKF